MGRAFPIAKHPWNDWYHIMFHTYGTWLPGDPKGFRTRHHRGHVEGDYKNPPPPGTYDELWKRSKHLMKRDPVWLTYEQRKLWAVRCECLPIANGGHFDRVIHYIPEHELKGAVVYRATVDSDEPVVQ